MRYMQSVFLVNYPFHDQETTIPKAALPQASASSWPQVFALGPLPTVLTHFSFLQTQRLHKHFPLRVATSSHCVFSQIEITRTGIASLIQIHQQLVSQIPALLGDTEGSARCQAHTVSRHRQRARGTGARQPWRNLLGWLFRTGHGFHRVPEHTGWDFWSCPSTVTGRKQSTQISYCPPAN